MRERVHADAPSVRHSGTVDRTELVVTCVVDETEHRSRVRRGIGSVENEFFLAALMSVPADTLGYVTPRFASALCSHSAAPMASVVEDPDGVLWARRELAAPVTVQEIEFAASSCARGVAVAHRWVGYGPRVVRAARPVSPLELTEAAHYGIGVISPDGERVLEPEAYRPGRWSSARWRFAEIIYGQIRHAGDGR